MATKVLDIDLSLFDRDPIEVAPYSRALALIRWGRSPLGLMPLEAPEGQISMTDVWQRTAEQWEEALASAALEELIPSPTDNQPHEKMEISSTVVVCTRNRPDDIRRCIEFLLKAIGTSDEIIIVDNAPCDDQTKRVVADYPVRYVLEPKKGLNRARSLGARLARGEVVIYADDDVAVSPHWIRSMSDPFSDPSVGSVTGLVLPLELETSAQEEVERYAGFAKSYQRGIYDMTNLSPLAVGSLGAGASMAFRKQLVNRLRLFDVPLGSGTPTLGGGDHYAFYRLLRRGYSIVFQPQAYSWHRHRRTQEELKRALYVYSAGAYSYLMSCLVVNRDPRALWAGTRWFASHHLSLLGSKLLKREGSQPWKYIWAQIRGAIAAPWLYFASVRAHRAELQDQPNR